MATKLKIITDAACRSSKPGFKGKAVGAAKFYDSAGEEVYTEEFNLGEVVAYEAECETVFKSLNAASGITRGGVEVWTDSESLVRHMNGDYRLKSDLSRSYFDKLKAMEFRFEEVKYFHHDRTTKLGQVAHVAASTAYARLHSPTQIT